MQRYLNYTPHKLHPPYFKHSVKVVHIDKQVKRGCLHAMNHDGGAEVHLIFSGVKILQK